MSVGVIASTILLMATIGLYIYAINHKPHKE